MELQLTAEKGIWPVKYLLQKS